MGGIPPEEKEGGGRAPLQSRRRTWTAAPAAAPPAAGWTLCPGLSPASFRDNEHQGRGNIAAFSAATKPEEHSILVTEARAGQLMRRLIALPDVPLFRTVADCIGRKNPEGKFVSI